MSNQSLLRGWSSALFSAAKAFDLFSSIQGRLYLAFGTVATLTVVCSIVCFYVFDITAATSEQIVSKNLPATASSFRLSKDVGALASFGPRLMAVSDQEKRTELADSLKKQSAELENEVLFIREYDRDHESEFESGKNDLLRRLQELNTAVSDRLRETERRRMAGVAVRKAHDAFIDAATPLIDDANFSLMTSAISADPAARRVIETLTSLLQLQSEANLLTGLLIEASLVIDPARLQPLREQIDASARHVKAFHGDLPSAQAAKLGISLAELLSEAERGGVIDLRASELAANKAAQKAFEAVQIVAFRLRNVVDGFVLRQSNSGQEAARRASSQVASGKLIVGLIGVLAVISSGLIAWLYVGRNLISRLTAFSAALRRIARGDLNVVIEASSSDEIGQMGQSLLVFQRSAGELITTRAAEQDRLAKAEINRARVQKATEEFDKVIQDVARAVTLACETMNDASSVMSTSSTQNQSQSQIAAEAAEQATKNVEVVAQASDQLAQSIAEIVTQVRGSADASAEASVQTEAILTAVGDLAGSVSEIGNVTSLIGEIASKTNLLALNATIEAARAGEAGRGFAIVAQEVKSLAAQTARATEVISKNIDRIQETTKSAVEAMGGIAKTILRLKDAASVVAAAVEEQGAVTHEIAQRAGAAAQGTAVVSLNVAEVSHTASKTEKTAADVLKAAGELTRRSDHLRRAVEEFISEVRAA